MEETKKLIGEFSVCKMGGTAVITFPKTARIALGIEPGDKAKIYLEGNHLIIEKNKKRQKK